jgi:cellulose biosynthesis protein BcsQ
MGQIYTFYSFKGGVGRSMSLANISYSLSKLGYDVLLIDFDLEAPGLEMFFKGFLNENNVQDREGIIDLLYQLQEPLAPDYNIKIWQSFINRIKFSELQKEIHFISAGKRDQNYFTKVRTFNIEGVYENNGEILENIRNDWKNNYDFVLIDSRTGVTDYGGICTVHFPDVLLLFYVTTEQSLNGIIDIYNRAKEARKKLPFDRKSLIGLPILSKFDSSEEYKISQEWIKLSTKRLSAVYSNWLPKDINTQDFVELTKIPYIPYFSFGEKLAVKEQSSKDPTGMVYAYETVSAIIADNLENVSNIIKNRDAFIEQQDRRQKEKNTMPFYKKKVFINYAKEDEYLATEIFNRLLDYGVEPWMNIKSIKPGEPIQETIENTIKETDIFLSIITKNYSDSVAAENEFEYAFNMTQNKINSRLKILTLIFEIVNLPRIIAESKSIDFKKQQNFDELISFIHPEYKTEQFNWSNEVEEKWINLLEENNEIKIKRQIFDIKDTLFSCLYDVIEMDGKEANLTIRKKFWDSINLLFIQLIVLIRYDIHKYFDELFDIITDIYKRTAGPNPRFSEDYSTGKQADIWYGIILRVYLLGSIAYNLKKFKIISGLIKVIPDFSEFWSRHYWIRHAQVLYARRMTKRENNVRNGVVYHSLNLLKEQYWLHRYIDPKRDDVINQLCEFDFIQCLLSIFEFNDESSCYPSFGQYYSHRLNKLLLDLISKRNAYQIFSGIPDQNLADAIIRLDAYADKVYGFYSGYDRNSFPPAVMSFLEKHRTQKPI